MAKRKYSGKRTKNMEPAAMTMTFGLPIAQAGTVSYIDLSQCASLANRRFYRQGINWAVAGFKIVAQSGQTGELTVSKLPNTWVMANSWEKSMRAWMKMNREAISETQSVRPRFLDYKIYADNLHHAAGFSANLLPAGHVAGEWESSKVHIPETTSPVGIATDLELIAVGASYPGVSAATGKDAVSLIEGYAASRALPDIADPNLPEDLRNAYGATPENWLTAMFNDATEQDADVLRDMIYENNQAPYPFEDDGVHIDTMYPGGANNAAGMQPHDITNFTGTSIGSISRLKGGNFPCGLIRFDAVNWNLGPGEESSLLLMIDLVPGPHRGYLCESMTEM